ncbi:MAG TPA: hypothetical protein VE978_22965 [Chitinophagales bacterium]|nr:hypothetical protein [Chitinophagales bacterium]
MKRRKEFSFNKIFVIESLFQSETKTGKGLYDTLKWQAQQIQGLHTQFVEIEDRGEFFRLLEEIKTEVNKEWNFSLSSF